MFFVLSKTIGIMILPTNFMIGVGLVGALLLTTRFISLGRKLLITSIVLLALCGFSPVGNFLLHLLESRFPAWDAAKGAPDGIVVLGGAIDTDLSVIHGTAAFGASAGRIIAAATLAHRYPNARILYSGGNANLVSDNKVKEADFVVSVFEGLGISKNRLVLERRSRNTFENAVFSKAMAAPKNGERWLLLTSAYHMPRSVGIFRNVGFAVEPYPVDWQLAGAADLRTFPVLSIEGMSRTDLASREWLGLLAYWIAGKTTEFFPGPVL